MTLGKRSRWTFADGRSMAEGQRSQNTGKLGRCQTPHSPQGHAKAKQQRVLGPQVLASRLPRWVVPAPRSIPGTLANSPAPTGTASTTEETQNGTGCREDPAQENGR